MLLDRDGTIIAEKHYLCTPDAVELLEGAAEGLRLLYDCGFGLIVVSNQSGIGRGLFTARIWCGLSAASIDLLAARAFASMASITALTRPGRTASAASPARTDNAQPAADFGFDPRDCWVIGDKPATWNCAAAERHSILVRTGYGAIRRPNARSRALCQTMYRII